jgi:hypothetical protein
MAIIAQRQAALDTKRLIEQNQQQKKDQEQKQQKSHSSIDHGQEEEEKVLERLLNANEKLRVASKYNPQQQDESLDDEISGINS